MSESLVCNTKAAALTVLETIAETLPRGTQANAISAVMDWIEENYPKDFSEETRQRVQSIYDRYFDDAGRKAVEWQVHGGEPPHGTRAEVPFIFNAETKTWELENEMPPVWTPPNEDILEKQEYAGEDDA